MTDNQKLKRKVEKCVANNLNKNVRELKKQVYKKEIIENRKFEYYKQNNFDNGLTIQNCFLFLAKEYGIDIPLVTKGFINRRLVRYNFKTGEFIYKRMKNRNSSKVMRKYMKEIYECVKEEMEYGYVLKRN